MQVTLDLSTSILEKRRLQNDSGLPNVIDLSSTQLERRNEQTSNQDTVRTMVTTERNSYGLNNESRGSELCSSTQSLSVTALHRKRLVGGYGCGRLKNEQNSSRKTCKNALLTPSSSCDISTLQADKQHASTTTLQGHCHQTLQFSSRHTDTDTATQCCSKFRRISHNKKPPASLHPHKNRTSFYSFPNLIFAYFLLISLLSPSLSLSTSLASTSPNLKSWNWVALETVDTGTERETSIHQVPIPDKTAIVGRLFQFWIPSSAFSGEVSSYKVRCSVVMLMMSLFLVCLMRFIICLISLWGLYS